MRSRLWLVSGLAVIVGLAVAGCGGSSSIGSSSQAGTSTGSSLTIHLNDFKFTPANSTVKAGTVKITAPNDGKVEHELVVLKTDTPSASLPVKGNEVDEEGFEKQSGAKNVGEIEEVGPGETKSNTFHLTPGKYVLICNVPGHYQAGMYGTLTVQ